MCVILYYFQERRDTQKQTRIFFKKNFFLGYIFLCQKIKYSQKVDKNIPPNRQKYPGKQISKKKNLKNRKNILNKQIKKYSGKTIKKSPKTERNP